MISFSEIPTGNMNKNHLLPLSLSTSSIDHYNHSQVSSQDHVRIHNKDISYQVFVRFYHFKTTKTVLLYQRYLRPDKYCSNLKEAKIEVFFLPVNSLLRSVIGQI